MFLEVRNPEVNGGGRMGGFVVVLVVVVIVVEAGLVLWVDLGAPEPPFGVQIGSFNGRFKQFCECRVNKNTINVKGSVGT